MSPRNCMRSAPIRRLRHPLEESPLWGVLGSVLAGVLALTVGLPVLLIVCILIPFCLLGRWLLLFIFWNRQSSTTGRGGPESVRGNDGRWLGSAWRYSVIHAVLIFEAGAGLDVDQLRNLLLTRVVPLYPRLTRRPVPLPLSAGAGHCWLPDSQFCIDRHVFAGPPLLTTEKQLQDYVGHLLGEGLSNDKPPWELHVLHSVGRHQDTVAVLRVHQSVADGMALVRVLCHSLADCQVLHVPQRPHFGALAFTLNIFRACLVGPLTLLFWLLLTTEDCNLLNQRKGWTGTFSVTWSAAITLPKVTRIKQVTRSTVNCVLLSALAGAARRLLQGCGVKQPPDMKNGGILILCSACVEAEIQLLCPKVYVDACRSCDLVVFLATEAEVVLPVDLRSDVTTPRLSSRLGSKLAPVVIGLPVGVEGAVPRLWATRRNLDTLRTSADPVVVYVATAALMATVPGKLARKLLSTLTGKATLQFSSLPGPTSTILVGGHPLKGVYPLLPAQNSLGLAVSVFTYADQVYVAIISDSTLGPAANTLLHHLNCQIDLLWQLLLHRRVPGESRSHILLRRADVTGSPVRELRLRLTCVQEEVQRLSTAQNPNHQNTVTDSSTDQQDATRLESLKAEFSELLSELRRRNSAAVPSNTPVFEDEEVSGEFWCPRRRAMSCSSSRRSSRTLVGFLTSARPASYIEPSSRSPTVASSPIASRTARPSSYIEPHSTSCSVAPRAATSECILSRNMDSPVKFIMHHHQRSIISEISNKLADKEQQTELQENLDYNNAVAKSKASIPNEYMPLINPTLTTVIIENCIDVPSNSEDVVQSLNHNEQNSNNIILVNEDTIQLSDSELNDVIVLKSCDHKHITQPTNTLFSNNEDQRHKEEAQCVKHKTVNAKYFTSEATVQTDLNDNEKIKTFEKGITLKVAYNNHKTTLEQVDFCTQCPSLDTESCNQEVDQYTSETEAVNITNAQIYEDNTQANYSSDENAHMFYQTPNISSNSLNFTIPNFQLASTSSDLQSPKDESHDISSSKSEIIKLKAKTYKNHREEARIQMPSCSSNSTNICISNIDHKIKNDIRKYHTSTESVLSPSHSAASSTADFSIGYCLMESLENSPTISAGSPKSSCSVASNTSISSEETINSSSTFPPSTPGSPVHSENSYKSSGVKEGNEKHCDDSMT